MTLICFGVFEMWSSPRITCVISSHTSSSGEAKLYVGRPSERTSTRSSSWAFGNSIGPLTMSSHAVTPSSGMRKRIAPSSSYALPSSTRRRATSGAVRGAIELKRHLAVPVEPEPGQGVADLLDSVRDLAARVRVLDPEAELASLVTREEPVEQRRANAPDVERPGRARGHANADGHGVG